MTVTVTLLGEPVAFARMRLSTRGIHYVPSEQRNTAAALRIAASQAMQETGAELIDEPVHVYLCAELGIPASWSKKKRYAALLNQIRPGKKPDIDNLYKLAADALCGVVYRDDALVCELHAVKQFSITPRLTITVRPLAAARQLEDAA